MREPGRHAGVVTPEAVALELDVAGLGSRMIATIIDLLIQGAALVGILIVFNALSSTLIPSRLLTVLLVLLLFVVFWGYYPLFEGLWSGRTPGKRAQHLRVVQVDGQPVTVGPVLVRNVLRIVDFLPTSYATGAIAIVLSERSQRIGDLAAGTIVVRETPAPGPLPLAEEPWTADPRLDTTGLTESEYDVVRSFLQRRVGLEQSARAALAHRLGVMLAEKVRGAEQFATPEAFLEAVARAYRARFGSL